ncbi:MAG: hypothetical protein WKG01_37590 [Kofleriaceae bacterium]
MRMFAKLVLAVVTTTVISGCVVRSRPGPRYKRCAPGYHMHNGFCRANR